MHVVDDFMHGITSTNISCLKSVVGYTDPPDGAAGTRDVVSHLCFVPLGNFNQIFSLTSLLISVISCCF